MNGGQYTRDAANVTLLHPGAMTLRSIRKNVLNQRPERITVAVDCAVLNGVFASRKEPSNNEERGAVELHRVPH